jgi:exonuclease VII large subunit
VKGSAPAAPTLIERAFDGSLVPLEDEPGVVAAYRVAPTPEERTQLDAIAARRSAAFSAILDEHYQQFTALGADLRRAAQMTAAERAGLLGRLAEVRDLLKPFAERGSFIDEARGVLGEERAAQARAMVDAWRAARIEELRKELGDAAPDDARLAAREQLQELGGMIRRTIERRADFAKAQFEDLAKRLELTPEQAEKVRALFMASAVRRIQGDRGGLSRRERQELFAELAKVLDEPQRATLREIILDR